MLYDAITALTKKTPTANIAATVAAPIDTPVAADIDAWYPGSVDNPWYKAQ